MPLPDELAGMLQRLEDELSRLAGQAPAAAMKAVAALERLTRDTAFQAACTADADGLPPATLGTALGISEDKARSRIRHYLMNH
ncbi:hypothetical protein ACFT5C_27895 [Streptomyces sp. NPDC057116]|uniref:hypothetical protein n=1 Tax=Streptomyces sp. NPDC057116 TaxID=3346023 RepID=UPI003628938B